jgi:hypothetical protein
MLYLHALRAARARQLWGRATRPLRRRRFPAGTAPCRPRPIPAAAALWRSEAFAPSAPPEPGSRLAGFHANYGEDVLAAARAENEDESKSLVASWIAEHPPRDDDAWHPYPLSTRVGNWLAAATLVPAIADETFAQSAWRQLLRLAHNVEDDILGNHVIRNARALVLGGVAFAAPTLTRRGLSILQRELPEQVLADGGHYERSPSYHLVVLRDLLEVQAVAPQPWLVEPIERMLRFGSALRRPDGAPALFNDGTVDAPRLALPPAPPGLAVFEQSGFVVIRDEPLWLAFRCGVAAPAFLPPHAHADALSFQLWWNGVPVVVDAGSSTYEPGPRRDWERGTAAHATVRVDGRDQFHVWGAFRSGPLPPVRLREAEPHALEAVLRLAGGIEHVRRLEWDRGSSELVVTDTINGEGRHSLESRLVWGPAAPAVTLTPTGSDAVAVDVEEIAVSERLGELVDTTATVARVDAELPVQLGWRLRLS